MGTAILITRETILTHRGGDDWSASSWLEPSERQSITQQAELIRLGGSHDPITTT